ANKGIKTTRAGRDFLPGRLRVGDYLIVPATGAGAPGVVRIKRAKGQRLLRRARVNGLSDEACGDGWHAEEDFWGNIECIQDDYVDPGDENDYPPEGGDDDWKSYLSIPEVASSINAYNSGQTGEQFGNSLSAGQLAAFQAICGILTAIAAISTIIGGPFVFGLCKLINQRLLNDGAGETPGDAPQYPLDCGYGFYQAGPGEPCLFAGAGDSCSNDGSDGKGYWVGTFNKDGDCIYDKGKTDAAKPTWLCSDYPGSTLWRSPAAGEGWVCLQGCGANETLDKSDGNCACNAGYKRDSAGNCVKSSGNLPTDKKDKKPATP